MFCLSARVCRVCLRQTWKKIVVESLCRFGPALWDLGAIFLIELRVKKRSPNVNTSYVLGSLFQESTQGFYIWSFIFLPSFFISRLALKTLNRIGNILKRIECPLELKHYRLKVTNCFNFIGLLSRWWLPYFFFPNFIITISYLADSTMIAFNGIDTC